MLFRWDKSSLIVHTPAKLNLFLEVLNKRPDGFHELETVMVMLGIYDTLRLTSIPHSALEATDPAVSLDIFSVHSANSDPTAFEPSRPLPSGADNLVVQAAELLRSHAGYEGGAHIELWKRIPSEAGLGGGSSDAAATLAGLNRLWKLNLPIEELRHLAARLGSDVPFFLSPSRSALCRGRGEIIEPLDLPLGLFFVVVRPPSGLSTPAVFRQWRPTGTCRSAKPLIEAVRQGSSPRLAGALFNALQSPAEELNADISRIREVFSNEPVSGHMMSGSGTAYFGVCRQRRQAQAVAARLSSRRIGCALVARSQF
jgi:4-diphosphocytidyl-2-C-methyl-D-erythritol kinase